MGLERCRHCQVANFASTTIHGPVSNHHSNPLWNLRSCWWFHLLPQTVLHVHARSYNDSSVFQHLMLDTLCRHTNPPAHRGRLHTTTPLPIMPGSSLLRGSPLHGEPFRPKPVITPSLSLGLHLKLQQQSTLYVQSIYNMISKMCHVLPD